MRKFLCGMAAVLVLAVAVGAAEEKVALDQLPKAVSEAVKKKFPKAELVGASKEKDGGKDVFEVALKAEGTTFDITLSPEGKILTVEKVIAAKDLPKAVADAVEAKYPKATHKVIEEITKDDKLEKYEFLLVTADKKTLEVTFDPAGKFIAEEDKKDEKPEEKKEEKKEPKKEGNQAAATADGLRYFVAADKGDKKGNNDDDDKGKKDGKKDGKDEGKGGSLTVDLSDLPPATAQQIIALVKELKKNSKGKKDENKEENKGNNKKDEKGNDKDEKKGNNKKDVKGNDGEQQGNFQGEFTKKGQGDKKEGKEEKKKGDKEDDDDKKGKKKSKKEDDDR